MSSSLSCQPGILAAHLRPVLQRHLGTLYGLTAALIWGGYLAVTNRGIGGGLEATDLAFLRYAVAALVLLPVWLRNEPLTFGGLGWARGLTLALLAGPPFVIVGAAGFAFAPLAHGAVIQLGTVTMLGAVFAAFLAREPLGRRQIAALAVVLAGLVVTAGPDILRGAPGVWRGDLLFFAAGAMWATFTVLQRRWRVDPIAATASVSVISGLIYTPIYLTGNGVAAFKSLSLATLAGQALMLGVLTGIVAFYAFVRAVELLGPGRAALFPTLSPAAAIVIGMALGSGLPTFWQAAGLTLLSIGLIAALRQR
jgi:drug/metabolite transporter (DMT)-like permease